MPAASAGPPVAVLAGVRGDGVQGTSRVVADDPGSVQLLARVHAAECAEEELRSVVAVAWDERWRPDGDELLTELVLRRRPPPASGAPPGSEGEVAVSEVSGGVSFLLEAGAAGDEVGRLRAGEPELRVPVRARAGRCDEHALLESTKRYRFGVRVQVGGAEPVLLEVVPPTSGRAALGALLDACARAV